MVEIMRAIPVADNAVKAWGMIQRDEYVSKGGRRLPISETAGAGWSAALQLMGLKTYEQAQLERMISARYDHRTDVKNLRKDFRQKSRQARDLIREGKWDEAKAIMRNLHALLMSAPDLSYQERQSIARGFWRADKDELEITVQDLIDRNQIRDLEILEEQY